MSAKTRKIVPSAIPAAWAISRVVTAAPWARKRGSVAATMVERRSSVRQGCGPAPVPCTEVVIGMRAYR